jgi:esterase/lipase superfamily enzyme
MTDHSWTDHAYCRAFVLVALLLVGGCQSQLTLMPTPEVLKDPRFNVFEANPEPMTTNTITTLYATTRVPAASGSGTPFTGKEDDQLHLGYARVRIGERDLHLRELIEQSTTGERQDKFAWSLIDAPIVGSAPRPTEHELFPPLPEEMADTFARLNRYIDEDAIRELTIYVHGANNTFYWSVSQGAQFQFFTGDNAMIMVFAWPSPGFALAYSSDKNRANAAGADLAYLIELLAQHSTATKINLLAYSAGGRTVGRALAELGERYTDPAELRLGQVYLTASDQPLEEFVHQLPRYFDLLEGLTITAAVHDPVLSLARMSDGKIRLGALGEGDSAELDLEPALYQRIVEIVNSDRMVLVDLENVPADQYTFTHGAWYDRSWVSTDVMVTLLGGLSAVERGLEPRMVNESRIWTFPPDYIERITATILSRRDSEAAPSGP